MQIPAIYYSLFTTPLGFIAIAWHKTALVRIQLPQKTKQETENRLLQELSLAIQANPPSFVNEALTQILLFFEGKPADFSKIPIDFSTAPPFHQQAYQAAKQIPFGTQITYGELALQIEKRGAARAIGQAMSKNPIPLIIPCHRVVAASKKIGGFSAYGGIALKKKLLSLEENSLSLSQFNPEEAIHFLCKQDKVLKKVIQKVGPFSLFSAPPTHDKPYEALGRSIIYQQLTGKAAESILNRVKQQLGQGEFPSPQVLLSSSKEQLRACGLSGAKATALQSLAEYTMFGKLKSREEFSHMSDEEIIQSLLPIKGIGRWTAEMFLLFSLHRQDILSLGDYGLKKGFQKIYNLPTFPTNKELAVHGEKWKPYRSIASFYLWRALDTAFFT